MRSALVATSRTSRPVALRKSSNWRSLCCGGTLTSMSVTQSANVGRWFKYGSINFGHSCEISREILAYPYPGRSAKINSGRGFPGQRISKKLMLRVRPGVELVRASLVPTRELMTLDLPTFDRPKNATSGSEGAGKWETSVAAARKLDKTLMLKFATARATLASEAAQTAKRTETPTTAVKQF